MLVKPHKRDKVGWLTSLEEEILKWKNTAKRVNKGNKHEAPATFRRDDHAHNGELLRGLSKQLSHVNGLIEQLQAALYRINRYSAVTYIKASDYRGDRYEISCTPTYGKTSGTALPTRQILQDKFGFASKDQVGGLMSSKGDANDVFIAHRELIAYMAHKKNSMVIAAMHDPMLFGELKQARRGRRKFKTTSRHILSINIDCHWTISPNHSNYERPEASLDRAGIDELIETAARSKDHLTLMSENLMAYLDMTEGAALQNYLIGCLTSLWVAKDHFDRALSRIMDGVLYVDLGYDRIKRNHTPETYEVASKLTEYSYGVVVHDGSYPIQMLKAEDVDQDMIERYMNIDEATITASKLGLRYRGVAKHTSGGGQLEPDRYWEAGQSLAEAGILPHLGYS